jgi:hypothetical protein
MYPNIINKSIYCLEIKHGVSLLYNTNKITVFREIIANRLFENYGKPYTLHINVGFILKSGGNTQWPIGAEGLSYLFLT